MTVRDTRASELAAAMWRSEGRITDISRQADWVTITTDSGIGFGITPEFAAARMEVGETVELCGELGRPIQGVRVGGRLVFFKTQADLEADRQRFLEDLAEKRRREYAENAERWRKDLADLPPPLRARMLRFCEEHGGFEKFFRDDGSGPYELFCCTEAAKFAEYFSRVFKERGITADVGDPDAEVRRFRDLDHEAQKALVAYDDGHSGNTFSGAVVLGARVALGIEV